MKILTAAQMREVDRVSTERCGIASLTLMENAGTRVVEVLAAHDAQLLHRRILVVCGKGNNGGDGLVIARLLAERGAKLHVVLCADKADVRGDAGVNLERYERTGGKLVCVRNKEEWDAARTDLTPPEIIVDALLGTGLNAPVTGWLGCVIDGVNRMRAAETNHRLEVIAVDIPSGISADEGYLGGAAIDADFTVTFTAPKCGMLRAYLPERVGRLRVVSIGSPRELVEEYGEGGLRWLEPWEFRAIPLRRKATAHKGDFGHALIVAGSVGKTGAAGMAGLAALRAGAGLVTVATPDVCVPMVAAHAPELMTEPLPSTSAGTISLRALEGKGWASLLAGKTVLAMGPGLTTNEETQEFVRTVVREASIPLVLDADALNAFAGHPGALGAHGSNCMVTTPHPGEMARLLGRSTKDVQQAKLETAREAEAQFRATVVLKGHQTIITSRKDRLWVNSTGNPGMAKAGSGDVLTGILAGILSQGLSPDWSLNVALGVYLHGLAGDIAVREVGEISLLATDIIRAIPAAFARLIAEIDDAEP